MLTLPRPRSSVRNEATAVASTSSQGGGSSNGAARVSLTEFHCFNRLPSAVRIRIWEFCLPRRTVVPSFGNAHPCAGLPNGPLPRGVLRPTTIARVCKEAQRVAFRSGSLCDVRWFFQETTPSVASSSYGMLAVLPRIWFDGKRDTVVLNNWGHFPFRGRTADEVTSVAVGRSCMEPEEALSRGLEIFRNPASFPMVKEFRYITKDLTMHATQQELKDTGLFDVPAEQVSCLVDQEDIASVAKLIRLCRTQDVNKNAHLSQLSSQLLDPWRSLPDYIQKRQEYVTSNWLLGSLKELPADDELRQDSSLWLKSYDLDGRVKYDLNWNHPWAEAALKRMPNFKLCMQFHICQSCLQDMPGNIAKQMPRNAHLPR